MNAPFRSSDIINHVGRAVYEKGRDYWDRGRVTRMARAGNQITGSVRGTRPSAYKPSITLNATGIAGSLCDCPVMYACKHVAALALKAIEGTVPAAAGKNASAPAAAPTRSSRSGSNWTEALRGLADRPGDPEPKGELRILLRLEKAQQVYRPREGDAGGWDLELRPQVYYPDARRVSMTDLQWKDVYSGAPTHRLGGTFISRRQSWFFQQLAQALRTGYFDESSKWLGVNSENAFPVWEVLSRSRSCGVALVCSDLQDTRPVPVHTTPVSLHVTIRDDADGVLLESAAHAGEDPARDGIRLLGDPPVFGAVLRRPPGLEAPDAPPQIVALHPADGLPPESASIAAWASHPVLIPQKEIALFVKDYAPQLLRGCRVENRSTRVALPVHAAPQLSVHVSKSGPDGVALSCVWKYAGVTVPLSSSEALCANGSELPILRDPDQERAIRAAVQGIWGLGPVQDRTVLRGPEAARFLTTALAELESDPRVAVVRDPDIPQPTDAGEPPSAEFSVTERNGDNDWFDFDMTVTVGGERVPFDRVFAALTVGEEYLFLPSGRFVLLKSPYFDRLRLLIQQARHLWDPKSGRWVVSRFQAGWWNELIQLGVVGRQADRWRESMQGLLDFKGVPILAQPAAFQGVLRHYQIEGYSWMRFLRDQGIGGILADDMGLGKTVQTISMIASCRDAADASSSEKRRPFLIVAPTSVVENWDAEFDRFAPHLKRVVMRRGDRTDAHERMADADVTVTSYALLQRDGDRFVGQAWDTVIFDEAQFVKNHLSKAYAFIRRLKARCKIALTGTPLENNLMELWSICSVAAPGLFPPPEKFKETFQKPIEKDSDREALGALRAHLRPFLLRRMKEMVEKELPPKTEQTWFVDMSPKQKHVYDVQLQRERQRVLGLLDDGGLKDHRFQILTALTRLRQLCLHADLVDAKHKDVPSAKLDELMDRLETILAEGHRVIVFSQFTSFLAHVKARFEARKWEYCYLDGTTTRRKQVLERFEKERQIPLFLISLKAGGFGLNLTSADYCVLLDPWWNPAVEAQAVDRTHRIGQTRHVMIYRMILKDTIEEKVLKLQEKKKALFSDVLEDGDAFSALVTESDIRNIFS